MKNNSLHNIGLKHGTDKADAGFLKLYELFFRNLRYEKVNILEIGVDNGYSLKTLYEYFPNATIYGLDIEDKRHFNNDRAKTILGDQADRVFLSSLPDNLDFIIDDGGHTMEQQMVSFGALFPKLKPNGGVYIIEDLGTSLMPAYGGNVDNTNTALSTLEFFRETGQLVSAHILPEEKQFIESNFDYTEVFGKYQLPPVNIGAICSITTRK